MPLEPVQLESANRITHDNLLSLCIGAASICVDDHRLLSNRVEPESERREGSKASFKELGHGVQSLIQPLAENWSYLFVG